MPIHDRKLISERVNRDECLRDETSLLAPMWYPDVETVKRSNTATAMRNMSFDSYDQFYSWSVRQPVEFWSQVLDTLQIRFAQPSREILAIGKTGSEPVRLPGARLNIVESCFQAVPDATAIVCGQENGEMSKVSCRELRVEVNQVANGLGRLGARPGDARRGPAVRTHKEAKKPRFDTHTIADRFAGPLPARHCAYPPPLLES